MIVVLLDLAVANSRCFICTSDGARFGNARFPVAGVSFFAKAEVTCIEFIDLLDRFVGEDHIVAGVRKFVDVSKRQEIGLDGDKV